MFRFFSKFLIQRNTVENIFKPNILQTLLGRRRRDIAEVEFLKGTYNKTNLMPFYLDGHKFTQMNKYVTKFDSKYIKVEFICRLI